MSPRVPFNYVTEHWSILNNKGLVRILVIFKIGLVTLMESSRRDLVSYVARHRSRLKSYLKYVLSFFFTPKTGIKQVLPLLPC